MPAIANSGRASVSAAFAFVLLSHYTFGVSGRWRKWLRRSVVVTAAIPVLACIGCIAMVELLPWQQPVSSTPPLIVLPYSVPLSAGEHNPLSTKGFYVDPTTSAAVAAREFTPPSGELLAIAGTPQFRWIGNEITVDAVAADVNAYVAAAESANRMPFLALYAIPHRDCGAFSSGGFATADEYRKWIAAIATGLGTAIVGIVLEPDALAAADCLPADQQQERLDLLREAVTTLTQDPNAVVYIDGGHSRWLTPEQLAERLSAVGVEHARGFSLNVSNFFTTSEEIAYGERVSSLLNGAHYVVDTSRNGAGPAPDGPLNWCNPTGRAIGVLPTTVTAGPHADAYLWIKRPGESDGDCNRAEPKSGLFFVPYAIDLVRNARP
jgi:endoglucanase